MNNVHQLNNYQPRFAVVPKSSNYSKNKGWVKDHRKSLENVIAKCCVKSHIWAFLLKSATHKPHTMRYGREQVLLQPGQLITSNAKILARFEDTASSLTPSIDHIRGAIDFMVREGMLRVEGSRKGSIFTVVNWVEYQGEIEAENTDFFPKQFPNMNPEHENTQEVSNYEAYIDFQEHQFPNHSQTAIPTIQEDNNLNLKTPCPIASANDRQDEIILSSDQPLLKVKSAPVPFQKIADAYNELIGDDFPKCQSVSSTKRKTAIRKFWKEMRSDLSRVQSYFTYFAEYATPHHRGQNDRGWKADIEFICRDTTVEKMRELGE